MRVRATSAWAALFIAFAVGPSQTGCNAGEATRRAAPAGPRDKERLFGDPGLVPSRAGERARSELALAADLRDATLAFPNAAVAAHAVVRVGPSGDVERALLVIATHDRSAATNAAEAAGRAVLGDATGRLDVELTDALRPKDPPDRSPTGWPLFVALLGLGFSTGVGFDRARRRLHARRLTRQRNKRRQST